VLVEREVEICQLASKSRPNLLSVLKTPGNWTVGSIHVGTKARDRLVLSVRQNESCVAVLSGILKQAPLTGV